MNSANPARPTVNVPDAGANDDVIGPVIDVDDDWDLEGAVGVDEVDKRTVKIVFSSFKIPVVPGD